jgi:transposase InsO family protein
MVAEIFIGQGLPVGKVLQAAGVSSSTYYYRPSNGKKGKRGSEYTLTLSGHFIPNDMVVDQIKALLQMEFVDYGYLKVTCWLRLRKNYIINPKKVYRLMKLHDLLNPKKRPKAPNRRWIKDWVPQPDQPFFYLEFDIKYIYIHAQRRNALLISVIDVDSRWLLKWKLAWSIRKGQVVALFQAILQHYPLPKYVFVRNDNGSQFVAQAVREFLEEAGIIQEFTRPATPEQNAHIESYHSIIENAICSRYELQNLEETDILFQRWDRFYNMDRLHSGIGYLSPYEYLLQKGIDMNEFLLYNKAGKQENLAT